MCVIKLKKKCFVTNFVLKASSRVLTVLIPIEKNKIHIYTEK